MIRVGRRRSLSVGLALVALALGGVGTAGGAAETLAVAPPAGDPNAHLAEILERSPAPEYRRFGSPGMAESADYAAGVLEHAGYTVLRHTVPATVYAVDYGPGHEPALTRLSDGLRFRTESAFSLGATTNADGVTCTVRVVDQVQPGDCGFVPYEQVSPEWNNVLADVGTPVRTIRARGGVGAILEGDREHDALIALHVSQPIPTVVSLVDAGSVVGQVVRLRAMGGEEPAVLHNVVAVRPPPDPAAGYVIVQGHLDGWFAAAADNGAGAAAVLAAAERLAGDRGRRGLLVALYDGEEWDRLGSEALVDDLARPEGLAIGACGPTIHLHDVVAVVNLDAPSAVASDLLGPVRDATGLLVPLFSWRVLVASEEPTVAALLVSTMTAAGVLGLPVTAEVAGPLNGGVARSDTAAFHDAGIPIAWPVAGFPEYHTEADRLDAVDPVDLANVATGTTALVRALDAAEIGRVGGALAAPGSSTPRGAPCAASATAAPSSTAPPAEGRSIPATGASTPLLPAAAALLVALGVLAPLRVGRD